MSKIKLVTDAYSTARGGWSRLQSLSCKECGQFICKYQKDGPGPLKRSYLDRIKDVAPAFDERGYLHCPSCKLILGFKDVYVKEDNRPVIRWAAEAISYKTISSKL
jgi:hypothetical protein